MIAVKSPTRWRKAFAGKWGENYRKMFSKYRAMDRKGAENGEKGHVIVGSLELFPGPSMGDAVESAIDYPGARKFR